MNTNQQITFIGGGNMAKCIIGGLIKNGFCANNINVSTPHQEKVEQLKKTFMINGSTSNVEEAKKADIIVLAIKPQMMSEVLKELAQNISSFNNKLIISIMAGVTIQRMQELLPNANRIVRVMPNTPALLGLGLAGLYSSAECSNDDIELADYLLKTCGKTVWVKEENDIDSITALSGSAPAYFFLFMECMVNKAKELGFSEEDAKLIIEQVALGSAQMVSQNKDKTIAELRQAVTSKGGTTFAALQVFEQDGLEQITHKAMDACIARAKEMAKMF